MRPSLTLTQFLLILAINVAFLLFITAHYLSETTKIVHDTRDVPGPIKIVTKYIKDCTTVVHQDNSQTVEYNEMMQTAQKMCGNNLQGDNDNLQTFQISSDGKPVFTCSN